MPLKDKLILVLFYPTNAAAFTVEKPCSFSGVLIVSIASVFGTFCNCSSIPEKPGKVRCRPDRAMRN